MKDRDMTTDGQDNKHKPDGRGHQVGEPPIQ